MKKKSLKILSLLLVTACLLSSVAFASTKASEYISYTNAFITKSGQTITINFTVQGTGNMNTIGVNYIYLYEDSGDGWHLAKTFSASNSAYTTDMLAYNAALKRGSVTYSGSSSSSYYAYVIFYAADSYGSDTLGQMAL